MSNLIRSAVLALASLILPVAAFAATPVPVPVYASTNAPSQTMSRNWAGYVATGQSYDGVHASWTVPSVSATTTSAADATWVGIGGYENSDLIQAGTMATVRNGRVSYDAWYEMLPAGMVTVPLTVSAGDQVTADIENAGGSQWTITITDSTTGQTSTTHTTYDSSKSSAEWIEERPSLSSGALIPLDSFGTVAITNAGVTVSGSNEPIGYLSTSALTMSNSSHQVIVQPSGISDGMNGAFTLSRTAADASDTASTTSSRRGLPDRFSASQGNSGRSLAGMHVTIVRVTASGTNGGHAIVQERSAITR